MPNNVPAFVADLAGAPDDARIARLKRTHVDYESHSTSWIVQLDAFEGDGGFLNGGYLWPYPRENQPEFDRRREMARYHNYLEALVDLYARYLFTQGVKRTSKSQDYLAWCEDVDGNGTTLTDLLRRLSAIALVNGHGAVLVDKTPEAPKGPTKADEQGQVIASVFTAPSILDWRFRRDELAAVKLLEDGVAPPLLAEQDGAPKRYLLWDAEGWARFDEKGILLAADTPELGLVPLVVLRPKESQLSSMLGRPLVAANVVRALFNRASEEDEVLRAQAFSMLTVEVPADGKVDEVRASLGGAVGAAKALVVKGTIKYETPSQEVPGAIRENISYLVQEIYRAAHVRFAREGLAIESGTSIRLQYTELNEMLQGFAKALTKVERQIARCWFGWTEASPEAAQAAFEASELTAEYPSEFFLDDLGVELEAWAQALTMDLGPTMAKHIKKRAVRRVDPEIPGPELKAIDGEIDAMTKEQLNPLPARPTAPAATSVMPGGRPKNMPPGGRVQ